MPHVQICQNATCTNMSKCHTCKYVIIPHVQICQNATCTNMSKCHMYKHIAKCLMYKNIAKCLMYKNIAKCHYVQKYRKMPLCTKISQNATMYKSMAKCHNVCTKYNKTSHVQNITKSHMNKIITKWQIWKHASTRLPQMIENLQHVFHIRP
jgi:hypothetical protein